MYLTSFELLFDVIHLNQYRVVFHVYKLALKNTWDDLQELFQIEQGVCTNCLLDCHKLVVHIRPLSMKRRREYIEKVAPKIAKREKM